MNIIQLIQSGRRIVHGFYFRYNCFSLRRTNALATDRFYGRAVSLPSRVRRQYKTKKTVVKFILHVPVGSLSDRRYLNTKFRRAQFLRYSSREQFVFRSKKKKSPGSQKFVPVEIELFVGRRRVFGLRMLRGTGVYRL